ncbi:hypothetical protein NPIL_456511 [Nephila pilipes]|uniref:Uncharacterized protein n=1 Tax=Nephila pilipes TaxID=299642 RepID=A0A8X6TFM6_NEPPI|nr:hypothetical protein NPIL_456511 [Nephila pilipes]
MCHQRTENCISTGGILCFRKGCIGSNKEAQSSSKSAISEPHRENNIAGGKDRPSRWLARSAFDSSTGNFANGKREMAPL